MLAFYKNYAYFTNANANTYIKCSIDPNGNLTTCVAVTLPDPGALSGPMFMAFHTLDATTYAYFVNSINNSYT